MDIGSIYGSYLNTTGTTAGTTSNVEKTLKSDIKGSSDEELMSACKQFEAYFYEQVFKKMEEAFVPDSDEKSGSNATLVDYYKSNLMAEYGKSAAEQSQNGLAQMLYEQMKRNYEL